MRAALQLDHSVASGGAQTGVEGRVGRPPGCVEVDPNEAVADDDAAVERGFEARADELMIPDVLEAHRRGDAGRAQQRDEDAGLLFAEALAAGDGACGAPAVARRKQRGHVVGDGVAHMVEAGAGLGEGVGGGGGEALRERLDLGRRALDDIGGVEALRGIGDLVRPLQLGGEVRGVGGQNASSETSIRSSEPFSMIFLLRVRLGSTLAQKNSADAIFPS